MKSLKVLSCLIVLFVLFCVFMSHASGGFRLTAPEAYENDHLPAYDIDHFTSN